MKGVECVLLLLLIHNTVMGLTWTSFVLLSFAMCGNCANGKSGKDFGFCSVSGCQARYEESEADLFPHLCGNCTVADLTEVCVCCVCVCVCVCCSTKSLTQICFCVCVGTAQ